MNGKILMLLAILVVVSTRAEAEWSRVDASEGNDFTYYADRATILKSGGMSTMWDMTDLKQPEVLPYGPVKEPVGSYRQKSEYDCEGKRTRLLAGIVYSASMGAANKSFRM